MSGRIVKLCQLDGSAHLKNTPTNSSGVDVAAGGNFFLIIPLVIFLEGSH